MSSEVDYLLSLRSIRERAKIVGEAAQAGKLLDYSAHAYESFTAITLAYVAINLVIMLLMSLVERKVRLPGNAGGK